MKIDSRINEIVNDCTEAILKQEDEARWRLIRFNCQMCRYAKVCNPKRGVEGFKIEDETSPLPNETFMNFTLKHNIIFRCSKMRHRKIPIPLEETRIFKIMKGEQK